MAFTPQSMSLFKAQAKQAGYTDPEINGYLSSKISEQNVAEVSDPNPIATQIGQGGLIRKILGGVFGVGERGVRNFMGVGANLALQRKALGGDKEAQRAVTQGTTPFWTPEEGKVMAGPDLGAKAKLQTKRVGGYASFGIPITGAIGTKLAQGFTIGALSTYSEDKAKLADALLGGVTGAATVGALDFAGKILRKMAVKGQKTLSPEQIAKYQDEYLKGNLESKIRGDVKAYEAAAIKGDRATMDALAGKHTGDSAWKVAQSAIDSETALPLDISKMKPRQQEALSRAMGDLSEVKALKPAEGIAEKAVEGARARAGGGQVSETVKNYSKDFIVPTKLAGPDRLDVMGTSKKLMEYGIKGNLDDLQRASYTVTGKDGVLSEINRRALSSVKASIGVDDAINAANKTVADEALLDEITSKKTLAIIKKSLNGGKAFKAGEGAKAFDAVQKLEELGYAAHGRSTYLSSNPMAEAVGDTYLNAAKALKGSLEKVAGAEDVIAKFKTPEVIKVLSDVSPKLADDFAKANTITELRALQKPFVNLSKIIDQTNTASYSQASRLSQGLTKTITEPITKPVIRGVQGVEARVADVLKGGISKVKRVVGPNIAPTAQKAGQIMTSPVTQGVAARAMTLPGTDQVFAPKPGVVEAPDTLGAEAQAPAADMVAAAAVNTIQNAFI